MKIMLASHNGDYLTPERIIENYTSFIWTERFQDLGEFEMILPSDRENRDSVAVDKLLYIGGSTRIMRIMEVDETVDEDGRRDMKVTGVSYEHILGERAAMRNTVLDMTPADAAREVYTESCWNFTGDGFLNAIGASPDISYYPEDTILEPTLGVRFEIKLTSTLDFIRDVCKRYSLGFRIARDRDAPVATDIYPALSFNVYSGSDRTKEVVFSEDSGSWIPSSDIRSIENHRNLAEVYAPGELVRVYEEGESEFSIFGLNRRVVIVDAMDLEPDTPGRTTIMETRGEMALREHRKARLVDGEVTPNSQFIYEKDYYVGDLVSVQTSDGARTEMRVVEYIFVSDAEGVRSYPTLSQEVEVVPGVWRHSAYDRFWNTMDETWSEQPS